MDEREDDNLEENIAKRLDTRASLTKAVSFSVTDAANDVAELAESEAATTAGKKRLSSAGTSGKTLAAGAGAETGGGDTGPKPT